MEAKRQVETEKHRTDETRQMVIEAVATSSNAWQKQLSEEHMRMMASEQRWEEEALFRKKVIDVIVICRLIDQSVFF